MRSYVNVVGALHALVALGLTLLGGLLLLVAVLMAVYGVYDCLVMWSTLLPGARPIHYWYPLENLINVLILAALVGVPGLVLWAAAAVEGFAGLGILRRWRLGRLAGFATVLPSLFLGVPGWLLGAGTVAVLMNDEVKREFSPT